MKLLRFIFLLVHLVVLVLLLGCLANAFVPPRIFSLLNFLSLGFPVLVIIHLLFTVFWILSWKKRAVFFLLVSVLFFQPVSRWINYHPRPEKEGELKVVTLNGKNGKFGFNKTNKYLQDQHADVIFLQEYHIEQGFPDRFINHPVVSMVSKHKILKEETIKIGGSNGNAHYADIEIRGTTIRFINVYLEPFYLDKSMVKPTAVQEENEEKAKILVGKMIPTFKIHQEQVEAIKRLADSSPYPVILGGDFNAVPNSYEYYHLKNGLTDAFESAGRGSATSFHDYKLPIRIDYLFSSKQIKPVSYRVDRNIKISDHFPVIATFTIQ